MGLEGDLGLRDGSGGLGEVSEGVREGAGGKGEELGRSSLSKNP